MEQQIKRGRGRPRKPRLEGTTNANTQHGTKLEAIPVAVSGVNSGIASGADDKSGVQTPRPVAMHRQIQYMYTPYFIP